MSIAYTFRTAQGVWINDMRDRALPHHQWPSVVLDGRAVEGLLSSIRLQAESGYNCLTVFGLLTASSWLPEIPRTVSRQRQRQVRRILAAARAHGLKVLYGLGVYSWGFDQIIEADPVVRGPNPHALCGSRPESRRWMEKVVDYLLAEFAFDGFHLEASDQGRCTCPACSSQSNTAYYSRINAQTAAYIRQRQPGAVLMVNMCGYLPWGTSVPRQEWSHLQELGRHLDFLIDAGHAGYFIPPQQRAKFIRSLPCAFGTSGGVWVYPPQRWNRLRWFLPYTRRTGAHLEELHAQGGRAVEYYMGPARNPGVEVNIAFGGRKLTQVRRDNHEILCEVLESLYRPTDAAAGAGLAEVFAEAEEGFFAHFDPQRPCGELHLTPLLGRRPGPPLYVQPGMTPAGRRAYGRRLQALLGRLERLAPRLRSPARLARLRACIRGTLADLSRPAP